MNQPISPDPANQEADEKNGLETPLPRATDEAVIDSTIAVKRTDKASPSDSGWEEIEEAPGMAPLQEGERLGPYEIREHIGDGGMASVYKAWHTGLHRFEALKIPRHQHTYGPEASFLRRLLTEARTSARLRHPHIVAIHNVSEAEASLQYFAMEFVGGCDLARLLESRGRLPVEEAFPILYQVACGLDYAHSQSVVHRDIKPANILLQKERRAARREEGESPQQTERRNRETVPEEDELASKLPFHGHWHAKVVDFGISRAGEDTGGTRLTRSGMIVGTPEYMSPEQSGSGEPVTYRTDIYSLAVVAYEVLCGTPPFTAGDGVSRVSILVKHVSAPPPTPKTYFPALPDAASAVLLQGLAKKPEDRFDTCVDFVKSLAIAMVGAAGELPVATGPGERRFASQNTAALNVPAATLLGISAEIPAPAPPPAEKNPRRSTMLAALGGLMVGAAIVFGWLGSEGQTVVHKAKPVRAKTAIVLPKPANTAPRSARTKAISAESGRAGSPRPPAGYQKAGAFAPENRYGKEAATCAIR